MARVKSKAAARRDRQYPQAARVFSTMFPDSLMEHSSKCFVPLEDYLELEKRYVRLFNRYKREVKR